MVLIDAARGGFLDLLTAGRSLAIAESVRDEVRYWRGDDGVAHAIDLHSLIDSGRLPLVTATVEELRHIVSRVPSRALGSGELESLALVCARGWRFCTADRAARQAMETLGVQDRWVSLAALARETPSFDVSDVKYR